MSEAKLSIWDCKKLIIVTERYIKIMEEMSLEKMSSEYKDIVFKLNQIILQEDK